MRQSDPAQLNIVSPEAMRLVGRALGHALSGAGEDPVVIGIEGELGAGKTTLVAGVLAALGVPGAIRSPTYTLIEPYEIQGRAVHHLDLYRLADPRETDALGVRDLLNPFAVLLIEWPSRGAGALPPTDLDLDIQYESAEFEAAAPDARVLRLAPNTRCGNKLVQAILAAEPELSALSP